MTCKFGRIDRNEAMQNVNGRFSIKKLKKKKGKSWDANDLLRDCGPMWIGFQLKKIFLIFFTLGTTSSLTNNSTFMKSNKKKKHTLFKSKTKNPIRTCIFAMKFVLSICPLLIIKQGNLAPPPILKKKSTQKKSTFWHQNEPLVIYMCTHFNLVKLCYDF